MSSHVVLILSKGGLRFASTSARDAFARLVLYQIRHTDSVMELSATMARRMQELVGGRMWMGAHMRRGDCEFYIHLCN